VFVPGLTAALMNQVVDDAARFTVTVQAIDKVLEFGKLVVANLRLASISDNGARLALHAAAGSGRTQAQACMYRVGKVAYVQRRHGRSSIGWNGDSVGVDVIVVNLLGSVIADG
jgi:hypothetical protein